MHFYYFQGLSVQLKWELELLKLPQSLVQPDQTPHVFGTLMALVLLQKLQVEIDLIYVQIAIWAEELGALTVVLYVPHEATLHLIDILLAEWALLLLCAL